MNVLATALRAHRTRSAPDGQPASRIGSAHSLGPPMRVAGSGSSTAETYRKACHPERGGERGLSKRSGLP
jgi:hypothetical protein